MSLNIPPAFPPQWQALVDQAATTLRALALDENAKHAFCTDPKLRPYMHRVAKRYVAGQTVEQALERVISITARGHAASAEYMGESCHDEAFAMAETEVFLTLVDGIGARGLNCSISFDLSHLGMLIDPELGYRNARKVASAAAAIGQEVMISMEGGDRADAIYMLYERLHREAGLSNVGITVPAKRHRTKDDLLQVMRLPGRIRLVKGAYLELPGHALERNSTELAQTYRRYAQLLLDSGKRCSIATHDASIQADLCGYIDDRDIAPGPYEFESLIGLGGKQIDALQKQGRSTREYAVFGEEYFLYVLNRIAEEPVRLYQAVIDVMAADDIPSLVSSKRHP